MSGFELLAQYYDRFVGADYPKIISFISDQIKKHLPKASLVCDIGCGSGTVTLGLLRQGFDMIGIDGSSEMLAEAMCKRADTPNSERALFLHQQLPEFELYGTVDAIVSTLDTLNYLTNKKDLERIFHWFRNYLNPNGLLIFDVNTLYKYQALLDNHCEVYDADDIFMSWRSSFEDELCSHQLTYFTLMGNRYLRRDEEQQQRYYSKETIEALLEQFGFDLLGVYDDYSQAVPNETTQRLTYVAQKKEN